MKKNRFMAEQISPDPAASGKQHPRRGDPSEGGGHGNDVPSIEKTVHRCQRERALGVAAAL